MRKKIARWGRKREKFLSSKVNNGEIGRRERKMREIEKGRN